MKLSAGNNRQLGGRSMPPIQRAISIRQPYVEQILLGVKKYE